MNDSVRIMIVGAHTAVGAEVARFAVSMGYEVIGLTPGEVDRIDPWQHGVVWKLMEALDSEVLTATCVVWAFDFDQPTGGRIPAEVRQVFLSKEAPMGVLAGNSVWLVSEGDPSLPAEQRAIAALRAAVEEGHEGVLSRDEVEYLGDAMMLQ